MRLLLCVLFSLTLGACTKTSPLPTVDSIDLSLYQGAWFEIAKIPNSFQKKCISDTQAHYAPLGAKKISVENKCKTAEGTWITAQAIAWPTDASQSRLKVSFVPYLKHLHLFGGDYYVIALGKSYDYALVGSPDRQFLWILSRAKTLDQDTYAALVHKAKGLGFNTDLLEKTPHTP